MNETIKTYQHSGNLPFNAALLMPLLLFVSALLAVLYTHIMVLNPLVYVSVFITYGCAWLLGYLCGYWALYFKVRSPSLAALVAMLVGAFFMYINWLVFIPLVLGEDDVISVARMLTSDPEQHWEIMMEIANEGWFTIKGGEVKGGILLSAWVGEALVMMGYPAYRAWKKVRGRVFCEACNGWANHTEDRILFNYPDAKALTELIKQGSLEFINDASKVQAGENHYRLDFDECSGCNNLNTISLKSASLNAKGKYICRSMVRQVPVSPEFIAAFKSE